MGPQFWLKMIGDCLRARVCAVGHRNSSALLQLEQRRHGGWVTLLWFSIPRHPSWERGTLIEVESLLGSGSGQQGGETRGLDPGDVPDHGETGMETEE